MSIHQQVMRISHRNLLEYLTGKRRVVNIPDGAKLLSAWFDRPFYPESEKIFLHLRIEHESLEGQGPGCRLRMVGVKYRNCDSTIPIEDAALKTATKKAGR